MRANDSQIDIYVIWINKNKPFNSSNDFKWLRPVPSLNKSYVATPKEAKFELRLEFQGRLTWKVRLEWRQFDLSQYNLISCQFTTTKKIKRHPKPPYLFVIIMWRISKSCEFNLTVLTFRFICDSKFSITLGLNFHLDSLKNCVNTVLLNCWNIRLHDWWDHLVVVWGLSRQSPAWVSATHRGWGYLAGIHPFRTEIPISKIIKFSFCNIF